MLPDSQTISWLSENFGLRIIVEDGNGARQNRNNVNRTICTCDIYVRY